MLPQPDQPAWIRHLLAQGRTYGGGEVPQGMLGDLLREGRVVEVAVGPSAYGSSSVTFSPTSPGDLDKVLRYPADYLISDPPPTADEIARMNDHDWDSGREFWSYHGRAETASLFTATGPERLRLKRSLSLMLAELMERLAFPYRAWSTAHRELLRAYAGGEPQATATNLRRSHWSPRFVFDPEGCWEQRGDVDALENLWSSLAADLSSYVADELKRDDHPHHHPDVRGDHHLCDAVVAALSSGARRWAVEAMWAIRYGDQEIIPLYPGLFSLPKSYSAYEGPAPGELRERLETSLAKLHREKGAVSIASSALVLMLRLINWSMDPPAEVGEPLEKVRQWCQQYGALPEQAEQLRSELRAVTSDPVLLDPLVLMDRRADWASVVSLTAEISEELGRREFQRLTNGVSSTESSAEECGRLWAEASCYEMLRTVFVRLRP